MSPQASINFFLMEGGSVHGDIVKDRQSKYEVPADHRRQAPAPGVDAVYSATLTESNDSPTPISTSASKPDSTFPKAVLKPFWRAL